MNQVLDGVKVGGVKNAPTQDLGWSDCANGVTVC